jgi:hypothetical protein
VRKLGAMMALSTKQYDLLEAAIVQGARISVWRRGTEYLVIPERLRLKNSRELIDARHPSTGHHLELWIDEIDGFEVVK